MSYEEIEKLLLSQMIRNEKGDTGKIESAKILIKKVRLPDKRVVKIYLIAEV